MNWSDITNRIYRTLNESAGNSHWESDLIASLAREGEAEFCTETEFLKAVESQLLTAGAETYDLPQDLIKVLAVKAGGVFLAPRNLAELQAELGDNWEEAVGAPRFYLSLGTQIQLAPKPAETIRWGLQVYFVKAPAGSGDSPSIPSLYHRALVYYGVKEALKMDQANLQAANFYEVLFQQELKKARRNLKNKDRKGSFRNASRDDLNNYWERWQ